MKVVGVGLNKTGTTTLGECLKHWGYRHLSCDYDAFQMWRKNDIEGLMQMVAAHDSFEDWPWPLVFKEIDQHFPGSRFILTERATPERWFNSLIRHAQKTGPREYRRVIYGCDWPADDREGHLRLYNNHQQDVIDYFANRDCLLRVCWENGDGWEALAEFLGHDVPDIPFPHANQKRSRMKRLIRQCERALGKKR